MYFLIKINTLTCAAQQFDFPKLDKPFIYRIVTTINPVLFKAIDAFLQTDQCFVQSLIGKYSILRFIRYI